MDVENQPLRSPRRALIILSVCLVFLSFNGFAGGLMMLTAPDGASLGMSVSDLERTPFVDFTLPGMLLIALWGVGSLITVWSLWTRPDVPALARIVRPLHEHWAWVLPLLIGVGLIVWLTVQVFTLPEVAAIQVILYVLAAIIIAIPLFPGVRAYYRT